MELPYAAMSSVTVAQPIDDGKFKLVRHKVDIDPLSKRMLRKR